MQKNYKSLTPRQARFAEEYLIDLNATQAAVRAGYSAVGARTQGSKLLAHAAIRAAIEAGKRERSAATKIDANFVLISAKELWDRCMQNVKPALHPKTRRHMKDEDGNLLYTFDSAGAARALKMIGDHVAVGAFEENLRVKGEIDIVARLNAGRARVRAEFIEGKCKRISEPGALPAPKEK